MDIRKYYAAYDKRYKTAHAQGISWSSDLSSPIVPLLPSGAAPQRSSDPGIRHHRLSPGF